MPRPYSLLAARANTNYSTRSHYHLHSRICLMNSLPEEIDWIRYWNWRDSLIPKSLYFPVKIADCSFALLFTSFLPFVFFSLFQLTHKILINFNYTTFALFSWLLFRDNLLGNGKITAALFSRPPPTPSKGKLICGLVYSSLTFAFSFSISPFPAYQPTSRTTRWIVVVTWTWLPSSSVPAVSSLSLFVKRKWVARTWKVHIVWNVRGRYKKSQAANSPERDQHPAGDENQQHKGHKNGCAG